MRKLEEGTLTEDSGQSYFVRLYDNSKREVNGLVCVVYNRKGLFKRKLFVKNFNTAYPSYLRMAKSTIVAMKLSVINTHKASKEFKQYAR